MDDDQEAMKKTRYGAEHHHPRDLEEKNYERSDYREDNDRAARRPGSGPHGFLLSLHVTDPSIQSLPHAPPPPHVHPLPHVRPPKPAVALPCPGMRLCRPPGNRRKKRRARQNGWHNGQQCETTQYL